MSQVAAIDLAHLREWIGREEVASDVLTEDLAQKYHATLDRPGATPMRGERAPRLIHFCLAQPVAPTASLGPDGHPQRGGFHPPVRLPRRMWAGSAFVFRGDIHVGDAVRRVSRIADVALKQGRSGALVFVTIEHRIEAGGSVVVEERRDIVYRDLDPPDAVAKPAPPAAPGEHRRPMRAEAPLLFRYSALTFNGHRIHYDRRYVTEAEGYPGLVVHGPLQAALLCDYAAEIAGAPPARFTFRGLAPLFDDDSFSLNATREDGRMRLWTAKEDGPACMSAEAFWD